MLSFSFQISGCQFSRFEEQVFHRSPKLPIVMREVLYEMSDEEMERLFRFDVLLTAMWAIMFLDSVSAIQAVFFFSQFSVAHFRIFTKNIKKQPYIVVP